MQKSKVGIESVRGRVKTAQNHVVLDRAPIYCSYNLQGYFKFVIGVLVVAGFKVRELKHVK